MHSFSKVRAENLKKEKDILKMAEVRLTQQRESLLAEQRGQNLLLTNLQSIQVHMTAFSMLFGFLVAIMNVCVKESLLSGGGDEFLLCTCL